MTGIVETQEELEESVKALVCRNNNLVELLEKANVKVPHFVGPKLLSFIVTVHDDDGDDDPAEPYANESSKRPSKTTDKKTASDLCEKSQNPNECKSKNQTTKVLENLPATDRPSYEKSNTNTLQSQNEMSQQQLQQRNQKQQGTALRSSHSDLQAGTLAELKEVQSFGSLDLIPVSNTTKSDPKTHEKPVKNFVEITPLISDGPQIGKIATKSENIDGKLSQAKGSTGVEGEIKMIQMFGFFAMPIEQSNFSILHLTETRNEKKSESVLDVSVTLTNVQLSKDDDKRIRPELKGEVVGVVTSAIDKSNDKSKAAPEIEVASRHVQCDKILPTKKCDSNEPNAIAANTVASSQSTISSTAPEIPRMQDEQMKIADNSTKETNDRSNKHQNEHNDKTIRSTSNETPCVAGKRTVASLVLSKHELSESMTNEKDLPDELFGSFRLDQTPNESNPNALSPTAAFLLAFPVVSTISSSKSTETDNSYSVGAGSLCRLDEKPHQPKDHLFESISSILNDLNDVSESKNLSNVVSQSHANSFPYCSDKNRTNVLDGEKAPSIALNDGSRPKLNQKNLRITNLLSDDKAKYSQSNATKPQCANAAKKISDSSSVAAASSVECITNSQMIGNPIANDRANFLSSSKAYDNCVTAHNENASDFYVSLSTLGLPLKSAVALPPTTAIPSVGSHFNFQISSLAQPRNLIESRPLVADTPFTFSLTKNSNVTTTSNIAAKTTAVTQSSDTGISSTDQYQMMAHRPNKAPKKTAPKHLVNDRFVVPTDPPLATLNRCNSFNPFSFDNPTMLATPSSSIGHLPLSTVPSTNSSISIGTSFTFTLTPSFSTIPTTITANSTALLSNHDPLFSSSFDMPIVRSTNAITKTPKKEKPMVPFASEKEQHQSSGWKNSLKNCPVQPMKSNKSLVNWMTSSVNSNSSKSVQDNFQLDFNAHTASHCGGGGVGIEEPSPWSIAMDNPGLISSSALPMLQGDLALNTMSTSTANNANPIPAPANEPDNKKSTTRQSSSNQSKYNVKSSNNNNRKHAEQIVQPMDPRGAKCSKTYKNPNHSYKSHNQHHHHHHHHSSTSSNNFHSVSQLLDQERQTVNKNTYSDYNLSDGKMLAKDSNSTMPASKSKYYPKYDIDSNNHHQTGENKYAMHSVCNAVGGNSSGVNSTTNHLNNVSELTPNDCNDRDLFGGYFFGQSKRLKLNYHHASSDLLSNQTGYDNSSANDMITSSYANYQSYDNTDCNNVSSNSCHNNLTNQSYAYQYTQPQPYNHQAQPLNTCDPIDTSTYFQTPVSTYKPPTFNVTAVNDTSRNDLKLSGTYQSPSFLHQPSKSSSASAAPAAPVTASTEHNSNASKACSTSSGYTAQIPLAPVNRNTSTIHYPSHTNINHNLPLNQAWNDGFSWMPYTTNSIDKTQIPYNNNLVFNATTDASINKPITSNNVGGNNNNTIPNFNLTTIFPDYNKS